MSDQLMDATTRQRTRRPRRRRGVASVLAMMFVVLFGSLAVAMAIVSRGNLRTAQTHLHVIRAMGAAETGMNVARKRLVDAASRFIIDKGSVEGTSGNGVGPRLWSGTMGAGDGRVSVLPAQGFPESSTPAGIVQALANAFAADANVVELSGAPSTPQTHSAPQGTNPSIFRTSDWLTTPAIAVDGTAQSDGAGPAAFQVTYAPLANGTDVRIIVTGYSSITTLGSAYTYSFDRQSQRYRPVSRVIEQDFRIVKRNGHAMLSPSRIMIGRNVQVVGRLGARYTDVAQTNGHPIQIKSDFMGLSPAMDQALQRFFDRLATADVDGDNRLRLGHPIEGQGVPPNEDFNGDGIPDNAFADATGDGYLDEFDIFMNMFDANRDGRVVLSPRLTAGTPAEGLTPEFTLDDDLALLIDSAVPDRNANGISGWADDNPRPLGTPGVPPKDRDPEHNVYSDRVLGWRDGVIDRKDQYAKVRGRLVFTAQQSAWEQAQGSYRPFIRGPIAPEDGESPVRFRATDGEAPPIDANTFTAAETPLRAAADGQPFAQQVASQLGISAAQLPTYVESSNDPTAPRYFRADLDDAAVYAMTGRHLYEKVPFNAPAYSDWYYRPRYENMHFKNVQIPQGNNGLFINCTFAGVTYVRSEVQNTHVNWSLYGKLDWSASDNRPMPNTQPLDKSDFLRYYTGQIGDGPSNYDQFPDPPVINGVTVTGANRNTKLYSNNIRFHNCLFVGSIVSDTPQGYTHVRNKLQFTGSTRFTDEHPTEPNNPALNPDQDDRLEIAKSSMLLPNYSVDVGQFNSPTDTFSGSGPTPQDVRLHGTIVAGVMDIRGTTFVDGSLLLTFAPVAGQGPLRDVLGNPVGNPASFNATIGYFGPEDGDGESVDPASLPVVGGHRIAGYDIDGDGLIDVPANQPQPPGSTPIPFYGYGRINLHWNPDLPMPDGIMLPVSAIALSETYREGRQ
jgi:hypothetical protein